MYATPWWSPKVALAVKAAKLAQREWLRTRDPAYKQEAIRLREARGRVIREAKQASFRQFIEEEAQGDNIWKLSRWAKGRTTQLAQVPTLETQSEGRPSNASSHSEKTLALRA